MIEDNALYARYRDGDRDAFSVLVARYRARLVIRAAKQVGWHDAEDIAQRVFIQLQDAAESFDENTSCVVSWMLWLTDDITNFLTSVKRV